MAAILGISARFHDSAAALLVDGRVAAAAQEERFSRRKHDDAMPREAVRYCLAAAGVAPGDLDSVVFYEKPLRRFERLLETWIAVAPRGFRAFRRALPSWLHEKLHLPRELDRLLDGRYRGDYLFADHHESHAASAFYPSPFESAAILTLDGVGEWATGTYGRGAGNRIELGHETRFPHSLGLLYSAFTTYLGFQVNDGEYKVMGLAPYGEPRFAPAILEHLADLRDDGSLWLDQRYFAYCYGLTMTSRRFHALFGGPPRRPDEPLTDRHMDLAASVQRVVEEAVLRSARHVHRETGERRLVLAGGVALNCVANGRVLREGPFDDLWIQPAAGDAGGALGAALFAWHQLRGEPRDPASDLQEGSLLGPAWSDREAAAELERAGARFRELPDDDALAAAVAERLAAGEVVGWFQGRMEFGPRALGNRSILGDPRRPEMQATMNRKIKYRESFRPFAPAVLDEDCGRYFELDRPSPYMLLVAPVAAEQLTAAPPSEARGLELLQVPRSTVPAVTHVDGSARVQTVRDAAGPRFVRLLEAFRGRTGCPVLVNTSFNVRDEPIVRTPADAYRCFLRTRMDALVVGRCVVERDRGATRLAAAPDAGRPPAGGPGSIGDLLQWGRRRVFADALDRQLPDHARVLVAGAGAGRLGAFLAVSGRPVVVAGGPLRALREGERLARSLGLGSCRFVAAEAAAPPVAEAAFDLVVTEGPDRAGDPGETWLRLAAAVRPGGHLIVAARRGPGRVLSALDGSGLERLGTFPPLRLGEAAGAETPLFAPGPAPATGVERLLLAAFRGLRPGRRGPADDGGPGDDDPVRVVARRPS